MSALDDKRSVKLTPRPCSCCKASKDPQTLLAVFNTGWRKPEEPLFMCAKCDGFDPR